MRVQLNSFSGDPSFIGNRNWNSRSNEGWIVATDGDGCIQWNYRSQGAPRTANSAVRSYLFPDRLRRVVTHG
jgi:hypothetical protein